MPAPKRFYVDIGRKASPGQNGHAPYQLYSGGSAKSVHDIDAECQATTAGDPEDGGTIVGPYLLNDILLEVAPSITAGLEANSPELIRHPSGSHVQPGAGCGPPQHGVVGNDLHPVVDVGLSDGGNGSRNVLRLGRQGSGNQEKSQKCQRFHGTIHGLGFDAVGTERRTG